MQYRKESNGTIIVLKRGEKIVETLNRFFAEQNILGGSITGIGALDWAEIGVYDLRKKEYVTKSFEGDLELVSLTGTVSEKGLHAHVMLTEFAGGKVKCFGGHLMEAKVSATCELFLVPLEKIERREDEETGLKLMEL